MTKFHTWLGGILVVQLLLAIVLFWSQRPPQQQNQQQPLLNLQVEQLDRLVVSDAGRSVTLEKVGGAWIIPALKQLPADAGKLTGLLAKLARLKTGWPVATTTGSHERFEVADDNFQRHLQLYQGTKLAGDLFIGSSPGFKKSHVRRPGDDAVYVAGLSSFEWPVDNEDWLDKALLAANDLDQIKGMDYALQKKGDNWQFLAEEKPQLSTEAKAAKLDQAKVRQWVAALKNLRVLSVAEKPPAADGKTVELQVSGPKGNWNYRFIKAGDRYFVSRNDRDAVFNISQLDFDRITGVDKAQLTATEKEKY